VRQKVSFTTNVYNCPFSFLFEAVKLDQPMEEIDDKNVPLQDRLARVRVSELVQKYLGAQELQLLGENGMSEAVQMFVDKDDSSSIKTSVLKAYLLFSTD
jgi:double-strand break repair protein MRE11